MAVVLGMTELWKLTQGDERHARPSGSWVERIHAAGKRLAATVERMLKLIRTDEFGQPLDLESTALEPLVRDVVDELEPFLAARRPAGRARRSTPTLGDGRGRPGQARRHPHEPARQRDQVHARRRHDPGRRPGPTAPTASGSRSPTRASGIDPATGRYLFEPFFTGFDTMHHSSGDYQFCKRGIGLGLCLVKTFVELHGGTVELRSTPGAGSTFAFTLPRHPSAALSLNALAC